jgi:hypothetical protein
MANHYCADVIFDLRTDLSMVDRQAVAFVVDGEGAVPDELPSHRYFVDREDPLEPLRIAYANFPVGAFVSMTWVRGGNPPEETRQLCLRMPSLTLERLYEDFLYLVDWLATLSQAKGFIGTVHDEDTADLVWVMFAHQGKLHIDFKPTIQPTAVEW